MDGWYKRNDMGGAAGGTVDDTAGGTMLGTVGGAVGGTVGGMVVLTERVGLPSAMAAKVSLSSAS